MVKIHGNWCGPNWTNGKNISARDYKLAGGKFNGPCIDRLDCACRAHDKGCAGKSGCTRRADLELVNACNKILRNPLYAITNPVMYAKARIIRDGIGIASILRRS